jgi:hypothetical protein
MYRPQTASKSALEVLGIQSRQFSDEGRSRLIFAEMKLMSNPDAKKG